MSKIELKAQNRTVFGRKVKNLRSKGLIPANVFGKSEKSVSIEIDTKEFDKVYKVSGETGLIELTLEKETKPVLVSNIQYHPITGDILHVDFVQVNLKEKIEAQVPVVMEGESPAEKQALGTVVQHLDEITVEALPTDLPEKFVVDVSELAEVDQTVYVKDLKVDRSKVEVKTSEEEIVVKVEPPQKEEVVETPVVAEGEAGAEGAPAEGGETPAEGTTEETAKE